MSDNGFDFGQNSEILDEYTAYNYFYQDLNLLKTKLHEIYPYQHQDEQQQQQQQQQQQFQIQLLPIDEPELQQHQYQPKYELFGSSSSHHNFPYKRNVFPPDVILTPTLAKEMNYEKIGDNSWRALYYYKSLLPTDGSIKVQIYYSIQKFLIYF